MPALPRPIFEIYVDDDRYAVPTLHLVPADDVADAREIVGRLLGENAHHLGAELCFEGELIVGVGTFEQAPRLTRI
jgi:hypothetical protein